MEIPQGYNLVPPEGFESQKRNPMIQGIMDGKSTIDLNGVSIKTRRSKNLQTYYDYLNKMEEHVKIPGGKYPARTAILDREGRVGLKPPSNLLISYWALLFPMRQYVIEKIKAPLQKAIENAKTLVDMSKDLMSAVKQIPLITRKNTSFLNTHILINEREKIRKYHTNPMRAKVVDNVITLDIFEYEHDGYYAFIQDMVLIDLAMELAKGNWIPRFKKFPIKGCWAGPDLPNVEMIRKQLREALKE